jgi:TolA-binding protein
MVAGTIDRAANQYNQAIGLIRRGKYGGAKDIFNTLIKAQDTPRPAISRYITSMPSS